MTVGGTRRPADCRPSDRLSLYGGVAALLVFPVDAVAGEERRAKNGPRRGDTRCSGGCVTMARATTTDRLFFVFFFPCFFHYFFFFFTFRAQQPARPSAVRMRRAATGPPRFLRRRPSQRRRLDAPPPPPPRDGRFFPRTTCQSLRTNFFFSKILFVCLFRYTIKPE